jgi:adenosylcobinamide-phosphate synthase
MPEPEHLQTALFILGGALILDLLLGEYPRFLHPVVWLGKTLSAGIYFAPRQGWWAQFLYGASLALVLVGLAGAVVYTAMELSARAPILHVGLGIFFLKASIALTELLRAAGRVWRPVQQENIAAAREALCSLCSRDPSELGPEELLEATVESLAENASDSWVAPLFYFVLFGVPGAAAYRAINTLDAMIGYRGRFEALGKFAARLDDVANWMPARLTAGLLLLAGFFLRKDVSGGWRILRRDGGNTPSPNAGRPMAVMAGLLGVRLAKKDVYNLGDPVRAVTVEIVREASVLVACTGWIMVGLTAAGVAGVACICGLLS